MSEERESQRKFLGSWLEFPVILLVSFGLIFGIVRPVVAEPFRIPSGSMIPTLEIGDRVLATKLSYDLSDVERGDIVIFQSPADGKTLIKRAVGLPGDNLEISGGELYINGEPQNEPYLEPDAQGSQPFGPVTVPTGHLFAMGDNRGYSTDSRVYGPVPEENLIGEAKVRFWPPDRIGLP